MTMNNQKATSILIGALVAASMCLVGPGCSEGGAGGGFSMPPMPVEVSPVKVQKVEDRFEAVGSIEAVEAITVVSEIDGAVMKIPFDEGEAIKKGGLKIGRASCRERV